MLAVALAFASLVALTVALVVTSAFASVVALAVALVFASAVALVVALVVALAAPLLLSMSLSLLLCERLHTQLFAATWLIVVVSPKQWISMEDLPKSFNSLLSSLLGNSIRYCFIHRC